MKKLVVFLLLVSGALIISVSAQSGRTRRQVENVPQDNQIIPDQKSNLTSTTKNETVPDNDVLKIDTSLVMISTAVMDRQGRFVTGLQQNDFKVFDNDKEQGIAYFAASEQPITVVLLLDVSESTRFNISEIREAATAFVRQLKEADQVMVVSFEEDVKVLSEPSNNRQQIFKAISKAKFGGGTSLYDAVDFVINRRLNKIEGRKAIVLFTDGVDTTSRRSTFESNLRNSEELDGTIFTIYYNTYDPKVDDGKFGYGVTREEYIVGAEYVEDLPAKTGGRLFQADSLRNLENAFFNIAEELRRQYVLGYYPPENVKAGERRKVKVRVNSANVAVRARDSYIVRKMEN